MVLVNYIIALSGLWFILWWGPAHCKLIYGNVWSRKEKLFTKVVMDLHTNVTRSVSCAAGASLYVCRSSAHQLCMKIQLGCASISIPDGAFPPTSLTRAEEFDCSSIAGRFTQRGPSSARNNSGGRVFKVTSTATAHKTKQIRCLDLRDFSIKMPRTSSAHLHACFLEAVVGFVKNDAFKPWNKAW